MTSASQQSNEAAEEGLLLLVDGIDWAWVTTESMMSAISNVTRTTWHPGLRLPTITSALDLKARRLESHTVTLEIDDCDGNKNLVALFGAVRESDTATDTFGGLEPGATAGSALYDKQVGTEQIGAAGQRRRHTCFPGYEVGMFHPSQGQCDGIGSARVPLASAGAPRLWAGRRACLYRLLRPMGASSWPDLDAAADIVWWGTISDAGRVDGRTWSIECEGEASWLRQPLNANSTSEPITLRPQPALAANERYIGVKIEINNVDIDTGGVFQADFRGSNWTDFGSYAFQSAIAGNTVADIDSAIATALAAAESATGAESGLAFDTDADGNFSYQSGSKTFRISHRDSTYDELASFGAITMHEKVWRQLGYIPSGPDRQGLLPTQDPYWMPFTPAPSTLPGYYVGRVCSNPRTNNTREPGYQLRLPIGDPYQPRWKAAGVLYRDPRVVGGQIVNVSADSGSVHVMPWQDRAPTPDTTAANSRLAGYDVDGSNPVDSTRLMLVYGKLRYVGSDEERDFAQVGRFSWRDVGEKRVGVDANGNQAMVLEAWEDPKDHGLPFERLAHDWSTGSDGGTIYAVPLATLSNAASGIPSRADLVARIMLHTTGTSTGWWSSTAYSTPVYGPIGFCQPGDNDPADSGLVVDRLGADAGLGIPKDLIAPRADWEREIADAGLLAGVQVSWVGPLTGEDVLQGLCDQLVLCPSLAGGKYGWMDPHRNLTPSDADAVLTEEDLVEGLPSQSIRHRRPIDAVKISYRLDPLKGDHRGEIQVASTDAGARYRSVQSEVSAECPWVVQQVGSDGLPQPVVGALYARWRRAFQWWAKRHFEVTLKVHRTKGHDLWPGSVVTLTRDPWLVNPAGSYGVSYVTGRVLSRTHDYAAGTTEVTVLFLETPVDGFPRILAPEVRATSYNDSTHVLTASDTDFRGVGSSHNDLAALVKPDWTAKTAESVIKIYQGTTADPSKYATLTATVSSVDTAAGTITLTGAPTGGSWLRDAQHLVVLADYTEQSSDWWGHDVFLPIANKDGEVDGDTANAVRFPDA